MKSAQHQAAALIGVAKRGGHAVALPAQIARLEKYRNKVDPDRVLDPAERERRARALLRADMIMLAIKSADSRRRTKSAAALREIAAEANAAADSIEAAS
jgi:hypothetical protein